MEEDDERDKKTEKEGQLWAEWKEHGMAAFERRFERAALALRACRTWQFRFARLALTYFSPAASREPRPAPTIVPLQLMNAGWPASEVIPWKSCTQSGNRTYVVVSWIVPYISLFPRSVWHLEGPSRFGSTVQDVLAS
uniref:Uncharacterized protein n=1 Tax=Physcomitrium patens TaxID=3218 RepID=A9SA44_PHYPA|nr:hypothetical protein PHYPA_001052 [Physcomitrium patens]